jgi:hypothetical protein
MEAGPAGDATQALPQIRRDSENTRPRYGRQPPDDGRAQRPVRRPEQRRHDDWRHDEGPPDNWRQESRRPDDWRQDDWGPNDWRQEEREPDLRRHDERMPAAWRQDEQWPPYDGDPRRDWRR